MVHTTFQGVFEDQIVRNCPGDTKPGNTPCKGGQPQAHPSPHKCNIDEHGMAVNEDNSAICGKFVAVCKKQP
jgi:hypothetical protein